MWKTENGFSRLIFGEIGIITKLVRVFSKFIIINWRACLFPGELHRRGYLVNHKRVRRLRRETGLQTVYPRPHFNTSELHPEYKKYPDLLKNLNIDRPNHVWATGITYTAVPDTGRS